MTFKPAKHKATKHHLGEEVVEAALLLLGSLQNVERHPLPPVLPQLLQDQVALPVRYVAVYDDL